VVVRRGDLDHVYPADGELARNAADRIEQCPSAEPAGFRSAGAGGRARVDNVDIDR
jgi:hypothetical protein